MKLFFISLILFSTTLHSFAQSENEIAADKIKSITVMNSDEKTGVDTYHKETVSTFDQKGNLLEEIHFNDDGTIKDHSKYTYDANGHKLTQTDLDASGKTVKKEEYTYDAKGNKLSKIVTDGSGKTKSKKKYVYTYYE